VEYHRSRPRAFALVSGDVLDRVLGAWLHTRAVQAGGRLVIAVDGKTVRGAKGKGGKAPHLVAALAHGIGAVLGQVAVDEKSNEIPAVRDLLKAFASLAAAVVTIDAMHTQGDTAQVILGRGADYVMTVKGNMPTLCRQLKKLPWAAVPAVSAVSTGHGRRARRTIKVALAPAWIEFDGAAQVAQLRRTVTKNGKKTVEVVYLITSDRDADPATLAAWVRGHWEIENKLHWVRDVTYQEDKSLVRTGNAPRVMASLPVD
jgi:predicted transposase YbfD/YdcC